jgi:hypothetical protein
MPIKNIFKRKNKEESPYEVPVPYRSPRVYEEPVPLQQNIYEKPDKCANNDYKCKFESCEKQRIQERPLPPIPKGTMRKNSGLYENDTVEGHYANVRGDEKRSKLYLPSMAADETAGGKKRRSTTRRRRNSKSKSRSKTRSSRKKRVKKTRKHKY